jgi:hypothetical protein
MPAMIELSRTEAARVARVLIDLRAPHTSVRGAANAHGIPAKPFAAILRRPERVTLLERSLDAIAIAAGLTRAELLVGHQQLPLFVGAPGSGDGGGDAPTPAPEWFHAGEVTDERLEGTHAALDQIIALHDCRTRVAGLRAELHQAVQQLVEVAAQAGEPPFCIKCKRNAPKPARKCCQTCIDRALEQHRQRRARAESSSAAGAATS